ncbi:translation initiation factor IF-2 subunit gamma [Candidatus Woesearchaeota archaeon]|nr:MAG: translation initiation factor IF-2 subunit gamma [Candidatus Woesearchaeota archaeon]
MKSKVNIQPVINIGLVGHVDHGKTTITERLSGKWADTHSEEKKRGITIRLGYANTTFYKCTKCKGPEAYTIDPQCKHCNSPAKELRKVSLVDAPGHETLMATMMSGSAIMDCALLLVAANESCPQPQTKEHLMALEISGIKKIIIVQNKIDLVSKEEALENYNQIKEFVKGTVAEKSPIIPISAQLGLNIDLLIEAIETEFPTPVRDLKKDPLMFIARSFDVNKPGTNIKELVGGVLGGSLVAGKLKVGDKIEIRPGLKLEKEGKVVWQPIISTIVGIMTGSDKIDEVVPGGSIALLTELDPSIVKSDSLAGNVVGHPEKLPPVWNELTLKPHLLDRVVGSSKELTVEPIKVNEPLMLNANASVTTGIVTSISKDSFKITLKRPICTSKESKISISRLMEHRFRLIGYATIV